MKKLLALVSVSLLGLCLCVVPAFCGVTHFSNLSSADSLYVGDDVVIADSLSVGGNADIVGNTTITGTATITGNTAITGTLTQTGAASFAGNTMATVAGTGITDSAEVYVASVVQMGSLYKTTILIDLTGLRGTAGDDIIGEDGTDKACHIGQITAARNGTIFAGHITCWETPAGGDPDVDLYSAVEADGIEDSLITDLDETKLINNGDWTGAIATPVTLTAYPAANEYLYLVEGTTTDADYTAGIFLIELWGK